MRISIPTLAFALAFASHALVAGDSTSAVITIDKKDYQATVSCETEDRSSRTDGAARIKVQIKGLPTGWIFTTLELTKAVDDTDKDLIRDKVVKLGNRLVDLNDEPSFSFRLKQSNRSAKKIKTIEGTLHLQNSEAGEPVTLADFKKRAGEFIANDELKKHGIKIAYIDKATFDDKGSKIIMDAILPKSIERDADTVKESMAQIKVAFTRESLVTLVVLDPKQKVLKVAAMDPNTKKTVKSISALGKVLMIPATQPSAADGKKPDYSHLQVFIKSDQLLRKVPVTFKSVTLP